MDNAGAQDALGGEGIFEFPKFNRSTRVLLYGSMGYKLDGLAILVGFDRINMEVTQEAIDELRRLVSVRVLGYEQAFRLAVPPVWTGGGDFGIVVDQLSNEDIVVVRGGSDEALLVIDSELEDNLEKAILDHKDTPNGRGFALDVY